MDAVRGESRKGLVRSAFVASLPVLTGYFTMGFAAGVLLALHGGLRFTSLWAGASSAILVSGPLQFLFVDWVRSGTAYADVAALVICLNIRYSLYGLSLLDRFAAAPWPVRVYLIGTVTDETYALQVQCPYPPGRAGTRYCLLLAAFDHAYWIFGVVGCRSRGGAAVRGEGDRLRDDGALPRDPHGPVPRAREPPACVDRRCMRCRGSGRDARLLRLLEDACACDGADSDYASVL